MVVAATPPPGLSAGDLAKWVQVKPIAQETPLASYFSTLEHLTRQAKVYRAEGNETQLFLKLFTVVRHAQSRLVSFCLAVSLSPQPAAGDAAQAPRLLAPALRERPRTLEEGAGGLHLSLRLLTPSSSSATPSWTSWTR
jgi:hypothetical protein